MNDITQFFTIVSSWAVAITAIVAALSAIFKPIGKFVGKVLGIRKGTDEIKKELIEVKNNMSSIKDNIEQIKISDERRDADLKTFKDEISNLHKEILRVSDENDDNERSRIRRDIMKYGDIARKGESISSRAFESLRLDYEKYHGALHGNGIVTEEYEFIRDYYNNNYSKWM